MPDRAMQMPGVISAVPIAGGQQEALGEWLPVLQHAGHSGAGGSQDAPDSDRGGGRD